MSSRTVSVVLSAQVQNYLTNMRAAEEQTLRLERSTRSATQQFRVHNEAVQRLGVGMLAVGATAAAGFALAVKASAEFGAKMAQLQSLSHANSATMKQAADAAMSVGTAYGFTATQVAHAQIELQKAGIGITQQLGGALKGALSLAAAGQLDVAQATEITTVAMTQFGLSAKDVPHLADLLSAGADKALGSVGDLGEALKNGGLQAHNMGLSLDDTVGLLSSFANVGIIGAEAGTQLRSMFLRLQNPTKEAKDTLDKYGISINDASGKFVGITQFAGELHDRLTTLKGTHEKLTDAQRNEALATVFGSHAIVGATALYQSGAKGISGWIDKVNESGFANAQAAGKMDSLKGDVQKLSAAFETDLIKSGSGANDMLRGLAKGATGALTVFGSIPGPLLTVGTALTATVAGVGLLGGAALIAVPKVVAFRSALTELGISGKQAAGTFAKGAALTAGLVVLSEGLAGLGQQGQATTQQIEQTGHAARSNFKDLDKLFSSTTFGGAKAGFKNALDFEGLGSSVQKFGSLNGAISGLSATVLRNEGTFDALGQQLAGLAGHSLPQAQQAFSGMVKQYGLNTDQTQKLLGLMPAYRDALIKQAGAAHINATDHNLLLLAQGKGTVSVKALAAAQASAAAAASKQAGTLADLAGQASSATTDIGSLQKAIEGFGSAQLDARGATRAMYQAIDDATDAAKQNGHTLDVHTKAGRANAAALDGIASAADQAASKVLKQTGSTAKAQAVMQTARDAFIKAASAMGLGGTKAAALADKLGLIPKNITTAVNATGFDTAAAKAAALRDLLNSLHSRAITIDVSKTGNGANFSDSRNTAIGKAAGGAIDGSGPKGVDSVPAILAPGEHVLTAHDVDSLGGQGGVYAFRRALAAGVQRFAKGGAVQARHGANTVARKPDPGKKGKPKKAPDLGAIHAQDAAADAAKKQAATAQRAIDAASKRLKAQQKAAKVAASALSKAQDAAAKISGKGTAKAKHAAEMHARDLSKKSKAAADRVKATQKTIDSATKTLDAAKEKQQAAQAAATQLRQGREDFQSQQRRATTANPIDPLSYVDQLRQMSRDDDFSPARRAAMDATANQAEGALVSLQTQSAAAAEKLSQLKDSSVQLHDSIKQAVTGSFSLSGAATAQNTSGWVMRGGLRYQTTSGGGTASSIAGYYQAGKASAQQFASILKQLAGRGVNAALLAELAGMGTDQGLPIAQAILSGSAADIASINDGYTGIQSAADTAGQTVADANYAAQIAAADANAQRITDAITVQGEALRKVVAQAFGLKGYATGTRSAAPGIRWVGEHGPELLGFGGAEAVLNAPDSKRWIRGVGGGGGAGGGTTRLVLEYPKAMALHDADGTFRGYVQTEARGVAQQEIAADAANDAVLMMGGAA